MLLCQFGVHWIAGAFFVRFAPASASGKRSTSLEKVRLGIQGRGEWQGKSIMCVCVLAYFRFFPDSPHIFGIYFVFPLSLHYPLLATRIHFVSSETFGSFGHFLASIVPYYVGGSDDITKWTWKQIKELFASVCTAWVSVYSWLYVLSILDGFNNWRIILVCAVDVETWVSDEMCGSHVGCIHPRHFHPFAMENCICT